MTARFKVRELLSRLRGQHRRRARLAPPQAQVLEARVLPAGNVSVRISGDTLLINGDRADNQVEVVVDDGNLIVRGLTNTTINGEEDEFVVVEDGETFEGHVIVRLGAGNDNLTIGDDVVINGRLTTEDFFGNDRIAINAASINGGLRIWTYFGNDSVRLNGTQIAGASFIRTGAGDDLVVLDNVTTSAYFKISAGPGDDGIDTDGNTFGNRFVVKLGYGDDDANFDGDTIESAWIVRARSGADAVRAENMTVEGFTLLTGGRGDDNFLFEDGNELTGRVIAMLGPGDDNLEFSDDNETTGGITKRGVEDDEVDEAIYTSRFDAATSGLIARADALRLAVDGALAIDLNTIPGTTQSNGVLLTKNQQVTITGTTHAGAVVTLDTDNDGFDDGTVTADDDGNFSFVVTLPPNATTPGVTLVKIRATFAGTTANVERKFDVVEGTVVRFATTLGNYDVELFNSDAPATVANFLNYLNRYTDSIIHRSEKTAGNQPFVIQGGGFVNPPDVVPIATDAPVANEFDASNSNVRGTLAMALPTGNINGGTSQWFVNTGNNSNLDAGKYTVFGKVLGDGMAVVDAIHALTSYNLIGPTGETALANVPLKNYTPFTTTLTGTASVTSGQKNVTGVGTNFLTDLRVGEAVKIGNVEGIVESIQGNTSFTLAVAAGSTVTGGEVKKNALPAEASYVTLNSVTTLTV